MHDLPDPRQILRIRNSLLKALMVDSNLDPEALSRLNLDCIRNGQCLRIGEGESTCLIPVVGEAKTLMNNWLILRMWARPIEQALFIALRGKASGSRLSVTAIRAVQKKFSRRTFRNEEQARSIQPALENSEAGERHKLRLIAGGKR